MTEAKIGHGLALRRGDGGGSEIFTTVAEVLNIGGPNLQMDVQDATNMDSADAYREKIAGLLDGGDVPFEVNWLPANATQNVATGILLDHQNRTLRNFQIVWPGGAPTWSFAAYVTGFTPNAPHNAKMTASLTLAISGKPTLA